MVSAATLFAMKDGFAKYLGGIYPVMQLLWVQYSLLLLIVLPTIVVRHGWRSLWPSHIIPQIARGMMSMLAVGLFYIAITEIPLADATALIFISPVVVTALSPFLLHENVGIRRWLAVIVGFIGIIFIVQPGFQEFRLGTLASLGAGVIWAFFQIMTRLLSATGNTSRYCALYSPDRCGNNEYIFAFLLGYTGIFRWGYAAADGWFCFGWSGAPNLCFCCRTSSRSCAIRLRHHNCCNSDWIYSFWGLTRSDDLGWDYSYYCQWHLHCSP